MTDFEKWLKGNYPVVGLDVCEKEGDRYIHKPIRNMHDAYLAGQQSKEAAIQEMDEVIKLQDDSLRKQEKQISGLQNRIDKALIACHESGVLGVFLAVKVEEALRGAND